MTDTPSQPPAAQGSPATIESPRLIILDPAVQFNSVSAMLPRSGYDFIRWVISILYGTVPWMAR
ncbi:MAG: hypothetical protein ACREXY_01430 [Gammaproteobacteria bacterium]